MAMIYFYLFILVIIFVYLLARLINKQKAEKKRTEEREDNVYYDAVSKIRRDN